MAASLFSGPLVAGGPLIGATTGNTPQEYGIFGSSLLYKGLGFPDLRFSINKDNMQSGTILSHFSAPNVSLLDATPAASNSALTTAGNATSGTAFVNVTAAAAGITPAVPFFPWQSTTLTTAIALDFGWGLISVTSASATATPATNTVFRYSVGQWLVIGNVGNAGGTIPLIAQVIAIGTTTITLSIPALATNASAPVGQANLFDTQSFAGQSAVATAHVPRIADGPALFLDPTQATMRGVGVTGVSGGAGGAVLIKGWDVYGQPQSETITATAGATTVWGVKTYKWFNSATPQFTDAHNYTVVTSDTFGFSLRGDEFEYMDLYFNATQATVAVSTASAWTAPDQTSPATTATGDVRGTFQVSSRGANATVTSSTFTNGTLRVAANLNVGIYNILKGTLNNPIPIYGVTPA